MSTSTPRDTIGPERDDADGQAQLRASEPPDAAGPDASPALRGFSEKEFYLEEFHGKTVAIAVAASELDAPEGLERVVRELVANETHVLLFSTERVALEPYTPGRVLPLAELESDRRLGGMVWRELRASGCAALAISDRAAFAATCRRVAVRLGLTKLVWIDRDGGLVRSTGERVSFMHLAELRELGPVANARRSQLLREVEETLIAGVPAVNVCSLAGLHDELFSYDGSGTLFTEERYVVVRRLGIDDYDAASDLIHRGVAEGYLAPRSQEQIDLVLASGFGAFIEGLHLAGIGALLETESDPSAEVASLYTLTRFLGEGVGGHLVQHAVSAARQLRLDYVYACTMSARVAAFFERNGFARVDQSQLPDDKWKGYADERRHAVICLRRDLLSTAQ